MSRVSLHDLDSSRPIGTAFADVVDNGTESERHQRSVSNSMDPVLSADHVFQGSGGLVPGTAILQPSAFDGGQASDKIAELVRAVAPTPGQPCRAAGALAKIVGSVPLSPDVFEFGAISDIALTVMPGDRVTMHGRSGRGEAEVRMVDVQVQIWMEDGAVDFEGMISISPVSEPGDSGAPVLTEDGRLMGMVFARSPEQTLVMPIQPVLDALGVRLVRQ